jgi:hypothetical protein
MHLMNEPFISRKEATWLFALACLVALIALFYAEENWRGKRSWESSRQTLEAEGIQLDWAALIPAPVPDEQNVFAVPEMQQWFVRVSAAPGISTGPGKGSMRVIANPPAAWWRGRTNTELAVLADVRVVPAGAAPAATHSEAVLRLDDRLFREHVEALLQSALGARAIGATAALVFVGPSAQQVNPLRLFVQTETNITLKKLAGILPTSVGWVGGGRLQIEPAGSNSFRIRLSAQAVPAADYLAWNDQFDTDFELMREALRRPYTRMGGFYRDPASIPIPNFIGIRTIVQTLAQRTQCHLLLNRPEEALRDLTLMHDLCRLLEAKPTMLVAAMIETAVTGLYASTVADGLRLRAWREPQLTAIQQQLEKVNLLQPFRRSLETERAAVCRTLETTPSGKFGSLFAGSSLGVMDVAPRGWVYQNMAAVARFDQMVMDSVDLTNQSVLPAKANKISGRMQSTLSRFSPYAFLAQMAVPNYLKASQTLALNQTFANQALLACAVERYWFAHQEYPETLAGLVPHFLNQIPRDLIGGQPLKYRRTGDGHFLLYSIGWNEIDDGGVPGKVVSEGDWVWR